MESMDYPVSWEELHRNARVLAHRIGDMDPFKGVIAVTRGGMVPAVVVARELEIRLIETICIVSYDHKTHGEPRVLRRPEGDGKGWLVIDDLVDTGKTASIVRNLLPKAHFATIYAKPAGRPMVDTFITEVSQNTWILFPWDIGLSYQKPIKSSE